MLTHEEGVKAKSAQFVYLLMQEHAMDTEVLDECLLTRKQARILNKQIAQAGKAYRWVKQA